MCVPGAADSSARIKSRPASCCPPSPHIHPVFAHREVVPGRNSGIFCPMEIPLARPRAPARSHLSLPILRELSLLCQEQLGLRNPLLLSLLRNGDYLLISCLLQAPGRCWSLSGSGGRGSGLAQEEHRRQNCPGQEGKRALGAVSTELSRIPGSAAWTAWE